MTQTIEWNGRPIPFVNGQTVAQALISAGIVSYGTSSSGQAFSVFCGIGLCQSCLVEVEGDAPREACLLPCFEGLILRAIGEISDD
jgi:NADH dehydrogenase/NADH:ubiquinone oxidoreductase subunit G